MSGTNGKTTTTRLLVEALGGPARVATSGAGANMAAGIVSALAADLELPAVLEVDEGHLPEIAGALAPSVIVLLNLSRDQLDRTSEVRLLADRWREALSDSTALVVANADDPLVVHAAQAAANCRFVAAGGLWHLDAYHCPRCDGPIAFAADGSWSSPCGFSRPEPYAALVGEELVLADGARRAIALSLPGRFNRANAVLAAVAAEGLGVALDDALSSLGAVGEIAGRFSHHRLGASELQLLLAKNPAGWAELLDLLAAGSGPVVIGINAREADGHDPSWLYDVPFERLAGRELTATGERAADLAVRLLHADLAHRTIPDQLAAVGAQPPGAVSYVGNYTAFQELRRRLEGLGSDPKPASIPASRIIAPRTGAPRGHSPRSSALRVVVVHPELLGTYGDVGNGLVLANRARWRGIEAELVLAHSGEALPRGGDLYVLGGGEDGPQLHAAGQLADGALAAAVAGGAAVLAVCAGFQILGESFPGPDGVALPGVGLIDATTFRPLAPRAVGELATRAPRLTGAPGAPRLSGFENHAGHTRLGSGVEPLGSVDAGVGNGERGVDGVWEGRIVGTYLHGPVLARNPALADALLTLATGEELAVLDDCEEEQLRRERFAALSGRGGRRGARWRGR